MKIAISNSIFFIQKSGGISRYYVELCKQVNFDKKNEMKIISPINKNYFLKDVNKKYKISFYFKRYPNFKLLEKLNNYISQIYLNKYNPDIFHESYYGNNFSFKRNIPRVTTIYDTIHEKFPFFYTEEQINKKKNTINKFDHFICISESTKKDFIQFYNVPESKVSVTYLAGNHFSLSKKNIIPKNDKELFLLYVGPRKLYKNFEIIYKLKKTYPSLTNLKVICFGGEKFTKKERSEYLKYNIFQVFGSTSVLENLYCSALCLIISSKYEGFCIPIVEAMQLGCPVISSDNPATVEIGSDAVVFFKNDSVEDLYYKINKVIFDEKFRNMHISKGFNRATFFSWNKCSNETLKIYNKVI